MKHEVPLNRAHRLLAGRPTCLMTTRYKGHVNVMSIAWVCPVSLEPPLVALAIHPARYSHDMLARSEELVLNIPGRPLAQRVIEIGEVSGANEDKLALTKLTSESGRRVEAPWIGECFGHIEAVVVGRLSPGDHTLFVAEIVGAWVEEDAFDERWLAPQDYEELLPLIHLGGRAFALMGPQFTVAQAP
ncbi:MAG: flavin reductase family protein [Chloroflexota bacterium]